MNLQNKKILVTGGCGAIGGNLVHGLVNIGCKEVIAVDDLSSGYVDNLPDSKAVRFIKGDISDDGTLIEIFRDKPEVVFHLAARFANQNSVDNPVEDLKTNSMGTLKMLKQSAENGVKKFIYTSSSCVYGHKEGELSETDVYFQLETPYAISKLSGEYYVKFFQSFHGLNTVVLRYFNSYGPGERPGKYRNVIPNFMHCALNTKPLVITGTGNETRDFNFVQDVVEATLKATEKDEAIGNTFNIGSSREVSIIELADTINKIANNAAGVKFVPRRSWDHVLRRNANIARAKIILGYAPRWNLNDGIAKTLEWFENNNIKSASFSD